MKSLVSPAEQILGKSAFDFVDDANRKILLEQLESRRPGHVEPYQISLSRGDGTQIACVNNANPVFEDGVHVGSVGLWTDVTELKRTQAELLDAKEAAEQASRAKSAFIDSVSHELRTPLNSLLGYAQLLQSGRPVALHERQAKFVERMLVAGQHLLELIEQLLDVLRIEQNKLNISCSALDATEVVLECYELMLPQAQAHGLELVIDVAEDVSVWADHLRLRQVLLNLLSNSIKYNKDEGWVCLTLQDSGQGWASISVADSGLGIPENLQQHLFEPFNRLAHENSAIEGTGVGLMISRELVRAMQGTISWESHAGVGTTFEIVLPSDEPQSDSSIDVDIESDEGTKILMLSEDVRGTVLYVEDNEANRQLVSDLSADINGIELLTSENAEQGLRVEKRSKPNLILLDLNLQGMNGIEAARTLRMDPRTRKIPIVALTAVALSELDTNVIERDFGAVLTKPLKLGAFLDVLERYLAN